MFFDRMTEEAKREIDDQLHELKRFESDRMGGIANNEQLIAELDPWYEKYT